MPHAEKKYLAVVDGEVPGCRPGTLEVFVFNELADAAK